MVSYTGHFPYLTGLWVVSIERDETSQDAAEFPFSADLTDCACDGTALNHACFLLLGLCYWIVPFLNARVYLQHIHMLGATWSLANTTFKISFSEGLFLSESTYTFHLER